MPRKYVKDKAPETLLPRHVSAYEFIESYINMKGFAPTHKELAAFLGINTQYASVTVNQLVALGCLERFPHKRRGLRCVKHPSKIVFENSDLAVKFK